MKILNRSLPLKVIFATTLAASAPAFAQRASIRETKGYQKIPARGLSASELFKRVSPSIVVVSSLDEKLNPVASGSGVVISFRSPARNKAFTRDGVLNNLVATNCHVVNKGVSGVVKVQQGEDSGLGVVVGKDLARDLCVVAAVIQDYKNGAVLKGKDGYGVTLKLPAAEVASVQGLQVGDPVYAIGAPKGLELTLSNGIVSGFRKHAGSLAIQTTAPISPGSSGGGLFDEQGRLVGITTMYLDGGQNLNFAMPAELIASVPEVGHSNVPPLTHTQRTSEPLRDGWLLVATRPDGIKLYIDSKTIEKSGSDVTAVWSARLPEVRDFFPNTSLTLLFDEARGVSIFHCGTRQETVLVYKLWLRGSFVPNESHQIDKVRMGISPGTIDEQLYTAACR